VDLWLRDSGLRVGQRVRIRLDANDVSVTLQPATATSIQNHVAVQVVSLQPDAHPSQVMVQLKAKESLFLARITARSVFELALTPGMMVWAQVKSVALIK
jgi:molybdate transport system ATP-binding protein